MDLSRSQRTLGGFWAGSEEGREAISACRARWKQEPAAHSGFPLLFPPIQEELEFCEKLLQTCFSSPTDDSMDR